MGKGGLVRARAHVVRREQAQLLRLLLVCVAWAVGQTLTIGLAIQGFDVIIPAGLAIGVYALTDDLGRGTLGPGGGGGGNVKYWRGRRIEGRVEEKQRKQSDRWN